MFLYLIMKRKIYLNTKQFIYIFSRTSHHIKSRIKNAKPSSSPFLLKLIHLIYLFSPMLFVYNNNNSNNNQNDEI